MIFKIFYSFFKYAIVIPNNNPIIPPLMIVPMLKPITPLIILTMRDPIAPAIDK